MSTEIVTVLVCSVPLASLAVKIYVVVYVGQTVCDPEIGTLYPRFEIITFVQLDVFQASNEDPPLVIYVGLAVKLLIKQLGVITLFTLITTDFV